MKKWQINNPDPQITKSLENSTGLNPFICKILASRGITSREAADAFFNSEELCDPFDILDMDKAVNVISAAVQDGEKIAVYGDYDCDGITATYMLFSYLEALGAEVCWYIPERSEGYGLNIPAIERLHAQGVSLIITVDNGISAVNEAKRIYELGMRLVITDHHQVPEILPEAEAVIDLHRPEDTSDFKLLAGCGVALKLIMALEGDSESILMQYADIAAVGTIGDIVSLEGENRIIVRKGLEYMTRTENYGLLQLLRQCGAEEDEEITSTFIAFSICPRINAAGRCKSPKIAMELLLCNDMNSAAAKAKELSEINAERQRIENEIVAAADEIIRSNPNLLNKRILIVSGEGWQHGIIGLTSTKLLHKYGKPNIVISNENGECRGSARSAEGLSLYDLLCACSDKLVRFGGHKKAAGLTLSPEKLTEFTEAAYDYCDKNIKESVTETLYADAVVTPSEMTIGNVELIERLEPFGEGNRQPAFLLQNCLIKSKKKLKEGKYISFGFDLGGSEYRAVYFGSTFDAFPFSEGEMTDILASLEINEFGGNRKISVRVLDIRPAGFKQERFFAAKTAYEDYRCGRVDKKLLCRMSPDNKDMKQGYDILKTTTILSKAELLAHKAGLNCCKFRIIVDVLCEFGLAETDLSRDFVRLIPAAAKADLSKSKILADLNKS